MGDQPGWPGRVGDRSADVNASFSNILDHLHFALMGMGDATWNNKIVLLTDADIRTSAISATPGPLFLGVSPNQKLFLLTPEGGYRILDERKDIWISSGHPVLASDNEPAVSTGVTSGH